MQIDDPLKEIDDLLRTTKEGSVLTFYLVRRRTYDFSVTGQLINHVITTKLNGNETKRNFSLDFLIDQSQKNRKFVALKGQDGPERKRENRPIDIEENINRKEIETVICRPISIEA